MRIFSVSENHLSGIKLEIFSGHTLLTLELTLKDLVLSKEPKPTSLKTDFYHSTLNKFRPSTITKVSVLKEIFSLSYVSVIGELQYTVVKVLRYKSERCCFDPRWCHGLFH
jgi:hypothetical protein